MRIRPVPVVRGAVFLALALGVASCTSGGAATASNGSLSGSSGPNGTATVVGGDGNGSSSGGLSAGGKGTVTITSGGKVVCVITLKGSTGSCQVSSAGYQPGTLQFTGSYNTGSGSVQSKTINVQLERAPTTTTIALSAGTVQYGHEQSERIQVRVAPKYSGTPDGKVTVVLDGSKTLCVITMTSAAGSCTLSASQLAAGSHKLSAAYPGSTVFQPSRTGLSATLTVTK
jgi:hypothetical protein